MLRSRIRKAFIHKDIDTVTVEYKNLNNLKHDVIFKCLSLTF